MAINLGENPFHCTKTFNNVYNWITQFIKIHVPLLVILYLWLNNIKWWKTEFLENFFFVFKQMSWLKDYYKMVEKFVIPELNARNDTRAIKWLTDRTNVIFSAWSSYLCYIYVYVLCFLFFFCLFSLDLHVTSTSWYFRFTKGRIKVKYSFCCFLIDSWPTT